MYKNLRWKLIVILAVTAASVWAFFPPAKKIKLGLDLQGGVHLILKVQTDDALRLETATSAEQLAQAAKDAGITVKAYPGPDQATQFTVEGLAPATDSQFRTLADQQVGTSFDRASGVGGNYVFTMRANTARDRRTEAVTQAIQTIERRVNELGVSEAVVAAYGSAGDQITVSLPGVSNVENAKNVIQNTSVLEYRLVEGGPAPDQATLLTSHNGQVPPDMEVMPGVSETPGDTNKQYYLVRKVPAVTGRDLRNARSTVDEYNTPAVSFTLNSEGVAKFSKVTAANVGRQLAIVLDGQVRVAPRIEGPIPGAEARITGRFTQEEVTNLQLILKSGALPASLTYQQQEEVGPSLGQDSIRAGIMASLMGLAFVTLFMLVYYKLAGVNALVSVGLNLVILMGFMAGIGAVMTLPGIAGFILTIGMGVDSNVLIFERIREELASGKGARQAVAAGFDRVFWTIVDTHVASLIAAAFLFQFGTGPIRGFATTLVFGLLANVFTAVFVSRTVFEFVLSRRPAGATQMSI